MCPAGQEVLSTISKEEGHWQAAILPMFAKAARRFSPFNGFFSAVVGALSVLPALKSNFWQWSDAGKDGHVQTGIDTKPHRSPSG